MSGKRSKGYQLTKDNFDDENEDGGDVGGTWKKADPTVLARRRGLEAERKAAKAARKNGGGKVGNGMNGGGVNNMQQKVGMIGVGFNSAAPAPAPPSTNAFSDFKGFGASSTPAPSFGSLKSISPSFQPQTIPILPSSSSSFGFGPSSSSSSNTTQEPSFNMASSSSLSQQKIMPPEPTYTDFASAFAAKGGKARGVIETTPPPVIPAVSSAPAVLPVWGKPSLPAPAPALSSQLSSSSSSSSSKLTRLNTSFQTWLQKQVLENPLSDYSEGVQDYINYATKLIDDGALDESKVSIAQVQRQAHVPASLPSPPPPPPVPKPPLAPPAPAPAAPSFNFGASATQPSSAPSSSVAPAFNFGAQSSSSSSASSLLPPVPAPAPAFGGFNFGGKAPSSASATAASSSSSSFNFGGSSSSTSSAPPSQSQSQSNSADAGAGVSDEDSFPVEQPSEVGAEVNLEEACLLEVKTKLFKYSSNTDDPGWKDRGVGICRLMSHNITGSNRIVIRTSVGKVSLNVAVKKGMKFEKKGGKVSSVQFVAVDEEGVGKFMIKVKPEGLDTFYDRLVGMTK